jgi:hypothetical protein
LGERPCLIWLSFARKKQLFCREYVAKFPAEWGYSYEICAIRCDEQKSSRRAWWYNFLFSQSFLRSPAVSRTNLSRLSRSLSGRVRIPAGRQKFPNDSAWLRCSLEGVSVAALHRRRDVGEPVASDRFLPCMRISHDGDSMAQGSLDFSMSGDVGHQWLWAVGIWGERRSRSRGRGEKPMADECLRVRLIEPGQGRAFASSQFAPQAKVQREDRTRRSWRTYSSRSLQDQAAP